MTVKRSRIYRSSSTGETAALPSPSPAPAAYFSAVKDERVRKVVATAENRRLKPTIFTISSPVEESFDQRSEDFLEKCSFCRKKFPKKADIYMYSEKGFCSRECRQKQIDIDKNLEILRARAKQVNTDKNQVYPNQGKIGGF